MGRLVAFARQRPRAVTAVLSIVGYAIVIVTFAGLAPIPEIDRSLGNTLSDAIAVVNSLALVSLLAGAVFIKRRQIARHRAAMLTAFALIMVFLMLYVTKVGGGFEKHIVLEEGQFLASYADVVYPAYIAMLVVHILLSAVSVPVVLHAVVLGLTHDVAELPNTIHPTVGRIAVAAWTLSLFLGVLTYVLLNHVYSWELMEQSSVLLLGVLTTRPIADLPRT